MPALFQFKPETVEELLGPAPTVADLLGQPPSPRLAAPGEIWAGVQVRQPKVKVDPDAELPVNRKLAAELRTKDEAEEGPALTPEGEDQPRANQKWPTPPDSALRLLREMPETKEAFEETYGPGAASRAKKA